MSVNNFIALGNYQSHVFCISKLYIYIVAICICISNVAHCQPLEHADQGFSPLFGIGTLHFVDSSLLIGSAQVNEEYAFIWLYDLETKEGRKAAEFSGAKPLIILMPRLEAVFFATTSTADFGSLRYGSMKSGRVVYLSEMSSVFETDSIARESIREMTRGDLLFVHPQKPQLYAAMTRFYVTDEETIAEERWLELRDQDSLGVLARGENRMVWCNPGRILLSEVDGNELIIFGETQLSEDGLATGNFQLGVYEADSLRHVWNIPIEGRPMAIRSGLTDGEMLITTYDDLRYRAWRLVIGGGEFRLDLLHTIEDGDLSSVVVAGDLLFGLARDSETESLTVFTIERYPEGGREIVRGRSIGFSVASMGVRVATWDRGESDFSLWRIDSEDVVVEGMVDTELFAEIE